MTIMCDHINDFSLSLDKNNNRYRNDNFKGRQTLGCAIFNKQYLLCYWNE